jgi:hypothetical protein
VLCVSCSPSETNKCMDTHNLYWSGNHRECMLLTVLIIYSQRKRTTITWDMNQTKKSGLLWCYMIVID